MRRRSFHSASQKRAACGLGERGGKRGVTRTRPAHSAVQPQSGPSGNSAHPTAASKAGDRATGRRYSRDAVVFLMVFCCGFGPLLVSSPALPPVAALLASFCRSSSLETLLGCSFVRWSVAVAECHPTPHCTRRPLGMDRCRQDRSRSQHRLLHPARRRSDPLQPRCPNSAARLSKRLAIR